MDGCRLTVWLRSTLAKFENAAKRPMLGSSSCSRWAVHQLLLHVLVLFSPIETLPSIQRESFVLLRASNSRAVLRKPSGRMFFFCNPLQVFIPMFQVLGQGSFGKVFLVRKIRGRDTGHIYAMKVSPMCASTFGSECV